MTASYADGLERQRNPIQFQRGAKAFQEGLKMQDNPYGFGTPEYEAWEQGWEEELTKENNDNST